MEANKEKELVCYVNMFDAEQTITTPRGIVKVPNGFLAALLPDICFKENVSKVHLFGNEQYISGIVKNARETAKTTYNKEIEIEVN
jgi:hypothetical protein